MLICPNCGYHDNPYWRHSRFDFNSDYMEKEEFQKQFPELWEKLKDKKNSEPIDIGYELVIYLRGTDSHYVYRVPKSDFKVPRERVNHSNKKVKVEATK